MRAAMMQKMPGKSWQQTNSGFLKNIFKIGSEFFFYSKLHLPQTSMMRGKAILAGTSIATTAA